MDSNGTHEDVKKHTDHNSNQLENKKSVWSNRRMNYDVVIGSVMFILAVGCVMAVYYTTTKKHASDATDSPTDGNYPNEEVTAIQGTVHHDYVVLKYEVYFNRSPTKLEHFTVTKLESCCSVKYIN